MKNLTVILNIEEFQIYSQKAEVVELIQMMKI